MRLKRKYKEKQEYQAIQNLLFESEKDNIWFDYHYERKQQRIQKKEERFSSKTMRKLSQIENVKKKNKVKHIKWEKFKNLSFIRIQDFSRQKQNYEHQSPKNRQIEELKYSSNLRAIQLLKRVVLPNYIKPQQTKQPQFIPIYPKSTKRRRKSTKRNSSLNLTNKQNKENPINSTQKQKHLFYSKKKVIH